MHQTVKQDKDHAAFYVFLFSLEFFTGAGVSSKKSGTSVLVDVDICNFRTLQTSFFFFCQEARSIISDEGLECQVRSRI